MAGIEVLDGGALLSFGLDDLMRYQGPAAPGGVAHGFQAMRRAWPLLCPDGPPRRREIRVDTAFPGPGARDAVEMVTRAVTEDRYVVDPGLGRPERGAAMERYVFRFSHRDRAVTVVVREGFVTDEFDALARTPDRTAAQEAQLTVLKQEMADRLLAVPADRAYDVLSNRRAW